MSTLNIPSQCDGQGSACAVVRPYLENGKCETSNCCTDVFAQSLKECYLCIGNARNIPDYAQPQATLDKFMEACVRGGFPMSEITFPGQDPNRPLNLQPPSSTHSASSTPVTSSQNVPTNTQSSASDAARSTTSKPPAGIIAGAVTGGVVFIILLIACLLLLLRRRRDSKRHFLPVEAVVSPFSDNNTRSEWVDEKRPGSIRPESMRPESTAARPESMKQQPGVSQQSEVATSSKDVRTVSAENTACETQHDSEEGSLPSSSRRTTRVIQHDDSGWRPARSPSPVEEEPGSPIGSVVEMPPRYEAAL